MARDDEAVELLREELRDAKRRETKLHLLSRTQAVLLRAHLCERLEERQTLEHEMLEALRECTCRPESGQNSHQELLARIPALEELCQPLAVPQNVIDGAVGRELEHLRRGAVEAVAEADRTRAELARLERELAEAERKNHKQQKQVIKFKDLLKEVRELSMQGKLPVGGVSEEEHETLRTKYDKLKEEVERLRSTQPQAGAAASPEPAKAAAAASADSPPPPPSAFMLPPAAAVSTNGAAASKAATAAKDSVAELESEKARLQKALAERTGEAEQLLEALFVAQAGRKKAEEELASARGASSAGAGATEGAVAALRKELEDSRGREAAARASVEAAVAEVARLQAEREETAQELTKELENVETEKEAELLALTEGMRVLKERDQQRTAASAAVAATAIAARRDLAGLRADIRRELASVPTVVATTAAAISSRTAGIDAEIAEVRRQYSRELRERRRLFNLVQELRGNIRVFCRCRPPTSRELEESHINSSVCVTFPAEGEVAICNEKGRKKAWEFDQVFGLESTQEQVYAEVAPLVTSVLDGYNACIFAYGQTGTGKTFTMNGPNDNRGVNTRALEELFKRAKERADEISDEIVVSVLEIYNEQIRDLLSERVGERRLEVRQGEHGMHVPDLTVVPVSELAEVLELLKVSDDNRSSACTDMNEHSSRSHMLLSAHVVSTNKTTGGVSRGKLHLIDLAGSERISKSGAAGQALKEAQSINKSLSALGDVIAARANKQAHVPFRNSLLTYLLQDSLSGDSKTLMFVCISPVMYNAEESFCSLNFASRVRTVELGKAAKHGDSSGSSSPAIQLQAGSPGVAAALSPVSTGGRAALTRKRL